MCPRCFHVLHMSSESSSIDTDPVADLGATMKGAVGLVHHSDYALHEDKKRSRSDAPRAAQIIEALLYRRAIAAFSVLLVVQSRADVFEFAQHLLALLEAPRFSMAPSLGEK